MLSKDDHVEAIFNRLHEEYETFVISINSRAESYSVEEIESLLLAQEAWIEKPTKELDSGSFNLATHRKQYKGGTGNTQDSSCPSSSSYHNHSKSSSKETRASILNQVKILTTKPSAEDEDIARTEAKYVGQ